MTTTIDAIPTTQAPPVALPPKSKDLSEPEKQHPIFRIFFHLPYAVTPLVATLTKTAGVYPNSSHFETEHPMRMRVLTASGAILLPTTTDPLRFFSVLSVNLNSVTSVLKIATFRDARALAIHGDTGSRIIALSTSYESLALHFLTVLVQNDW